MKSLRTVFLIAVFALMFTCSVGAQALQEPAESARPVTLTPFLQRIDLPSNTISLSLRANNQTDQAVSCVFYTVLRYQEATIPDSCQKQSRTLNEGAQIVQLSHSFTKTSDSAQLTVYCWNAAMAPMSEPLVLPVTFEQTVQSLSLIPKDFSLILSQNQTKALTYTHQPATVPCDGLLYYSADQEIATVSQTGVVTPKKPGKTQIYAITADRSAYDVCQVTVISDITRITLNHTNLTLGSATQLTAKLTATVTPDDAPVKTFSFQSSNPSVVTVDAGGTVTALAKGQAVITVTTTDGQAVATCAVTVTEIVKEIKLNQTAVTMWDYGEYLLTATVSPAGEHTVVWTSSNDNVATVSDNGIVYGISKGTAIITARIGNITATCTVSVHREYDYMGSVAAYFESKDNPASISGSGTGKAYGCFQLYAGSGGPQSFYNWLIDTGFNPDIGSTLKLAHAKDGGGKSNYGANFDAAWQKLAAEQREEFRSCQMVYCMTNFYQPLAERLAMELGFYADNYGLALKAALWSRSIQHGTGGAFNRVRDAFSALGGFAGKTEKQLIAAIYAECGAVVSTPPSDRAIPMNSDSEIARTYGLVGKYMKYYSANPSSVQAGVWKRLNITEPNMLYAMIDNPPLVITPQK